jgi:hypothetical protein
MPTLGDLMGLGADAQGNQGLLGSINSRLAFLGRNLGDLMRNPADWLAKAPADFGDRYVQPMANAADQMGSVIPGVSQQGAQNMLPFAMGGMTVYHGSPYRFDKFDPSKIGTGEGAQAKGYGLYSAEAPATANTYKGAGARLLDTHTGTLVDTRDIQPNDLADWVRKNPDARYITPPGYLYTADLPDEHIARMLHWDKPMTEQPANVQQALGMGDPNGWAQQNPTMTGRDVWNTLSQTYASPDLSGPAKAAEALNSMGIPGIRYLDQGSRQAGEGTSNFVVFPGSTDILKILGVQ